MLADTVGYLPDDLLVKVDRASMSVGLEIRTPYLDPAIFEFAWSLQNGPDSHLLDRKKVLRDLVSPLVPESVVRRPKTGFGVPIGEWLRGSLHDWADDLLDPIQIARQGHLEPLVIQEMWRQHIDRRADHADALWAVLMFQAWLNEVSRD
jgi:asparagine synthase (glutamine-hydrolysing)